MDPKQNVEDAIASCNPPDPECVDIARKMVPSIFINTMRIVGGIVKMISQPIGSVISGAVQIIDGIFKLHELERERRCRKFVECVVSHLIRLAYEIEKTQKASMRNEYYRQKILEEYERRMAEYALQLEPNVRVIEESPLDKLGTFVVVVVVSSLLGLAIFSKRAGGKA